MKTSTRLFGLLLITLAVLLGQTVQGQSILDPTDPVVTYNSASPPTQPAYGTIGKWVRTVRMSWSTTGYKAYIYKGCQFRLYFPKTYNPTAVDGKRYPMFVFYHGVGEAGTIYDNEYQLYHGGQIFANAVANGTFDGYVLCMQTSGGWGPSQYGPIKEIIDYMVTNNKLDPFHVCGNGLSGGGGGTWNFYLTYPTYNSNIVPMSAVSIDYTADSIVNKAKYTAIWNIHGGLDGSPAPYTAQQVNAAFQAKGANYVDLNMTTQGHDTWDSTWSMPAFWPFVNAGYASNPWTLFGRTQFCPGDAINVTIGLQPGFDAYVWRKDGVVIPGATTNTINVTTTGTYDAQVKRGSVWSDWSHTPAVISLKAPTVTPPITVAGTMSKVIPALDGNSGVTLTVNGNYVSYLWQKVGSTATIGTGSTLYATTPGNYVVQVTEQYGCSSNFSPAFTVVDAGGPNKPDPASGLNITALSSTSLLLNWSQNPSPVNNETNFEIYQGTQAGGPYKLVAITAADVSKDTLTGLSAGAKYYYIIRAVDNTGAAAASSEASGTTIADTQPPTAPANLTVTTTSRSSVALSWSASTDNVGVTEYDLYINGAKSYVVPPTQTQFTATNLVYGQSYTFVVKAVDLAGNNSPASNQVTGQALWTGLSYKYYTFTSAPSVLPNYSTLTPVLTGTAATVSLTPATQTTNFGFLWEGLLHVTQAGNYNFNTTSHNGSKLYLGTLNSTASAYNFSATALVSNDGAHNTATVNSASITLAVGVYPIAIAYFNGSGTPAMTANWKTPGSGSYVAIPASAFVDAPIVNGQAPAAPSNLVATAVSYNKISLQWTDNSTNETGFEVWRSANAKTGFITIGTTAAAATTYIDSTVTASTRYYYQIRAIGQYGQSPFTSNYTEAYWQFNNNYNDSSGNAHALTAISNPVFDATAANKVEGTYAIKLNGTNQAITVSNTGSFLQEAYSQRTIAFWMKSAANTSNRVVFDFGGSDDGLALVLNNNTLIAAVASANVRSNISAAYTSTGWNHIAVVYNGDSLLLYINGVLAASNTSLSFHSLGTTTNGARIGQTNGTNAYNTTGGFFSGWIDAFGVYNTALSTDVINNLKNFTYAQSNATTQALPAVPAAPTGFSAAAASSSAVNLAWTNNAVNADNYQVYRSANNNQSYVLWAVLPATAVSYTDTGLFANAVYYYQVRAVNAGGNSAFAPESYAKTLDNPPVITKLADQQARYGTTTSIAVSATHVGGGTVVLTQYNLPAFAQLTDNGDGTGVLTLTPAATDQGNYTNLSIVATDAFGGADTTHFNLAVNNNYPPTIDTIASYTLNESDTLTIPLSAHDQNASDTLTLTVSNLPGNVFTLTPQSNGVASLFLHPGFAASGVYTVQVKATDNNGLSSTRSFTVTVKDKDPNTKIFTRFAYQDAGALPTQWNALLGATTTNLLDSSGTPTTVGLVFNPTYWWNTYNGGSSTGNNSGVYPDAVLQDYYWFGSVYGGPDVINGSVTGTDTSQLYNLTFFANSVYNGVGDNGTTTFTVGSQTVNLYVQNNTTNTVSINNIKPAADGTIAFSVGKTATTPLGYMNALVITKQFDDGTAPAPASALTGQRAPGQVSLNWTDAAYNATGYEVWRAPAATGVYSLLGTAAGNTANSYVDSNITGNTQYYYTVRAYNGHGFSTYSDTVTVTTANRLPKINAIADVSLKNNQQQTINVTTVDDSTAHLVLTAANLPPFATFTDNGNGTGVITIVPTAGTVGVYPNVTVTVADQLDSTASTSFTLAVTEPNVQSVYVNFSDGTVAPKPWNTLTTPPFAGTVMSNLVDDSNVPTTMSLTMPDGFYWFSTSGWVTGNNDGVYPSSVIRTGVYEPTTATRRLQISGLSAAKLYNFVFFNSQRDGTPGVTNFTINGQTVSLNAMFNINKTVQINGIAADANGQVTISVAKASGASNAYLSTVVIQAYDNTPGLVLNPTDLRALTTTQTTVKLQWQDRSAIETGFEVWRASDANGTYAKVGTVAANATTYTDGGLSRNSTYYYIVRAVNGSVYSDYSSVLPVTTYSDAVYVNVTTASDGAAPWNNLNQPSAIGLVWNNFVDSTGNPTSISMTQTQDFAGANSLGMVTGNNSGVYPDAVIMEDYVAFQGQEGAFQLSGLNLSKTYDLTFFGSDNLYGDNTGAYIVNGDTVFLNAMYNTNATVTMRGLVPDNTGRLLVKIRPYGINSGGGWINAMVIQGFNASTQTAPAPPVSTGGTNTNVVTGARAATLALTQQSQTTTQADVVISAYPNPFHQFFTLSVPADNNNEKVQVTVYDISGRLAYLKEFSNLSQGDNYLRIDADQNFSQPGIYLIKVVYANLKTVKTFKLIKQ